MSESYGAAVPTVTAPSDANSSLETAKHEAGDLKNTAVNEAGHVADTAKGEAKAVAREVKYQAKDLFAQTQRELRDQAQVQQARIASGLRSVGRELDSMTAAVENPGLATDLLRQASGRISGAAGWLGDRDPGSVLREVKSFARRRPGTFIVGAAVLGVVAGRLTRALASNASDDQPSAATDQRSLPAYGGSGAPSAYADAGMPTASSARSATQRTVDDTPVFAQSSAASGANVPGEGGDVRSDSV